MTKTILPKGSSCSTCKARKVRCDAIRPACTACRRSARFRHENPEEVECCYTTTRRSVKREDGLAKERNEKRKGKGKAVASPISDEEDLMGSTESSYPSRSISPSLSSSDVDSTNRFTWATPLPPSACLESPESSSSQFFPSYGSPAPASISPIDDFSFPLDLPDLYSNPLPLSSSEYYPLANTTLFETPSFYSALPLSPSKVSPAQLLIPRQDFDTPFPYQQKDTFLSSPSSISSSSSSYPSSLASFDPLDHPFALADELTFYHSDSSVPPSPPFSPSIEPAKNDFSHCFLPDANAFESLTLPMFQPHTSSSLW